jgi:cytoskeletal protein CcmA (bactofilin family)
MFNNPKNQKANKMEASKHQPAINMISQGTELRGSVNTKNDIRISGKIDGEVRAEGKVILTNDGFIKGDIYASEADIAGKVDGEIVTSKKLVLRQSAGITGDINTQTLLVEEGAVFEGACKMSKTINQDIIRNGTSKHKKNSESKTEVVQ